MIDSVLSFFAPLGQFVRQTLERWRPITKPRFPFSEPTRANTWSETNDNWHEDPNVYVWHEAPTNGWEAAALPPGWLDFTVQPTPTTLTPQERHKAEYRQIRNLKA